MVSGRRAESDGIREELADIAVETVYFEDLDSLAGRLRRVNLDRRVVGRGAAVVVVRKKVKCQASFGRGL